MLAPTAVSVLSVEVEFHCGIYLPYVAGFGLEYGVLDTSCDVWKIGLQ